MLSIHRFITGPIETNTWLLCNREGRCLIVDPSSGCEELLDAIEAGHLVPEAVVLTHGHFDHFLGLPEILDRHPDLPVYVHAADLPALTRPELNGSLMLGAGAAFSGAATELVPGRMRIGSFDVEIRFVPGHSPGGCALVVDNYCFCGDTLFAGAIGRSDLAGGNGRLLLESIASALLTLPDDTIVCPGHGGRTSIGRERRSNPFLTE